jgi:hypothetical protein
LLKLETDGFTCRQWSGEQTCKPGDWIVDNAGTVYTLDCDSFARTDRADSPDLYRKVAPNWADLAHHDAAIKTKEGALPGLQGRAETGRLCGHGARVRNYVRASQMSRSIVITLATCSTLNGGWAGDGDNNLAAAVDPERRNRAFISLDLLKNDSCMSGRQSRGLCIPGTLFRVRE